jgi:hypothetical protein
MYMTQEDLNTLSKEELSNRMDALSKETTASYDKVANAKDENEKMAAEAAYKGITANYDELKAEYDKRANS